MYTVKRSDNNPLITPHNEYPWEAKAAFNGCPIKCGKKTHLLYRALSHPDLLMAPGGISSIGMAISTDGENFKNHTQLISPEEDWEKFGCEDPRVTFFEGKYIIFYTAISDVPFNSNTIKVGMAISRDLKKIDEKHPVTPFNAKAMMLFPERVGGKITAILTAHTDEPPAHMAVVQCDKMEDLWNPVFWEKWHAKLPEYVIDPRRSDRDHVEAGAPPIKTKDGWLFIYSYIQNYFGGGDRVFGIEAVLLDLKNPRKIVGRTRGPFLVPEEPYEKYGTVPDIVFPSGVILQKNGMLDVYYGAADTVCAKASLHLPDLLDSMIPERREKIAKRAPENPIIAPNPKNSWESRATFNTGAIELEKTIYLLYRAMSEDNTSVFGLATTKDGVKISKRFPEPVYKPRAEFEMKKGNPNGNSGCEDPRLTQIGSTLYVGYTAYDGVRSPRAALSSIPVKDFIAQKFSSWAEPQLVTPDYVDDKDMCIFPAKIKGKFLVMHRISGQICADLLPTLDFSSRRIDRCIEIMGPRKGMWDSEKVGIAAPPIKTKKGWLLIYHGVSKTSNYRLGAALLDLKDPTVVISRTADPIFEPVEKYELEGEVPRVVFSCGIIPRGDNLLIYYGGADKVTGVAKLSIKKLLSILSPKTISSL